MNKNNQISDVRVLSVINQAGFGGAEKLITESIPLFNNFITNDVLILSSKNGLFKFDNCTADCFALSTTMSLYNPLLVFRLIRYLKNYDIIHVHLFPSLYWVALAKLISRSQVVLVITEHSTNNRRRRNSVFRAFDKFIYKNYKGIICITDETKIELAKHLGPVKKLQTIPNGVDLKVIKAAVPSNRNCLGLKETDILLIQVASFRDAKDQDTSIRALINLPSHIKLLLAGEGPRRKACESLAVSLNLEQRVFFLGNRTDIPNLLKMSDVVVMSSHYEGFGLSAVEGMAAGKPVVASRVPGLASVVEGAGILFEPKNDRELSTIIQRLVQDPEYYNTTKVACIERSIHFNIEKMVKSYVHLYNVYYNREALRP